MIKPKVKYIACKVWLGIQHGRSLLYELQDQLKMFPPLNFHILLAQVSKVTSLLDT